MTLPPTADQEAPPAPPLDLVSAPAGWRRFLDNEPLLYTLTFCVMVAGCLLVPKLLNNMIFVLVFLMLGVVAVPMLLKRYIRAAPSEIDRKGVEH